MCNRYKFAMVMFAVVFIFAGVQSAAEPNLLIPTIERPDFSRLTSCPVVRIIDCATIVVDINNVSITVRLIGADAPETINPYKPAEHYGKEASDFTSNLLKGERVYIMKDPQQGETDQFGQTLAYIYRYPDGLFINAEIIRQGYGHAHTKLPFKFMGEFKQLEKFAQETKKGLWNVAPVREEPNITTTHSSSARPEQKTKTIPPQDVNSQENVSDSDKTVYVHGYYRKDGTYVSPYYRRSPRR